MRNGPPDITIAIISTDTLSFLLPCLRSVFDNSRGLDLEVYVIDNASREALAPVIAEQFPQVQVLRNDTRLGFSSNNNIILGQGHGRHLMLLNDDTVILNDALRTMMRFLDDHPDAGAVGASLQNGDGSFQAAFARFPHPVLEGILPATNWVRPPSNADPLQVDSVYGAALMVRREIIERVGVLDTRFDPIYSEEVDWCYRIKMAGWKIYSLPDAKVIHYGSQTMNRAVPRKYELLLSHKLLFFRKHGGPAATTIYRLSLGLATLGKATWWSVADLLGGKAFNAKERRELHWHLLKNLRRL